MPIIPKYVFKKKGAVNFEEMGSPGSNIMLRNLFLLIPTYKLQNKKKVFLYSIRNPD